jgi:hypothetical protein
MCRHLPRLLLGSDLTELDPQDLPLHLQESDLQDLPMVALDLRGFQCRCKCKCQFGSNRPESAT